MVFNLSAELFQIMSECEAVGLQQCAAQGGLRGGLLGVKGLQLPVEGRDAEEKICQFLGELRPSVTDRAAWALQLQDAFKPFDRVAQQQMCPHQCLKPRRSLGIRIGVGMPLSGEFNEPGLQGLPLDPRAYGQAQSLKGIGQGSSFGLHQTFPKRVAASC